MFHFKCKLLYIFYQRALLKVTENWTCFHQKQTSNHRLLPEFNFSDSSQPQYWFFTLILLWQRFICLAGSVEFLVVWKRKLQCTVYSQNFLCGLMGQKNSKSSLLAKPAAICQRLKLLCFFLSSSCRLNQCSPLSDLNLFTHFNQSYIFLVLLLQCEWGLSVLGYVH